jgi:hypothetical protein
MRQAHGTAIAANYQIARRQSIMGTTTVATTLGYFPFRLWGHDFLLLVPQPLFGYGSSINMPGSNCPANFQTSGRIIAGSRDDVKFIQRQSHFSKTNICVS